MTVDERNRLQLAEALKRVLGDDEGITLMELLPPVGWADVATRHDLLALEQRIDLRFDRAESELDRRFTAVDARFAEIDGRFARVDARFDIMDARIDGLKFEILGTMERELRGLTWRLFALNAALIGAVFGGLVALVKL